MRAQAVILATCALAVTGTAGVATAQEVELTPGRQLTSFTARITAVVNAETVKVRTTSGRTRTIRLAGVDAPRIRRNGTVECGALSALDSLLRKSFTRSKDTDHDGLKDRAGGSGRKVIVTTEPGVGAPKGMSVAYVEPTAKGSGQLNVVQILAGWARLDQDGSLSQGSNLAIAEQVAKQQGAGLWGGCGGEFHADGSLVF
jgi:endonuclease YncB( thermonuclease family)